MNSKPIALAAAFAACLATGSAHALVAEFDNDSVNIIASGSPDTAFVAGVNTDPFDVSIDQETGDYGGTGASHGLLQFHDFALPANVTINSATLSFYTTSSSPGPVSFYRMISAWDASATWNSFGGDGITPGVEALSQAGAVSVGPIANSTPLHFDVTSIVAAWVAGSANYGFGIVNASTNGWDFHIVDSGVAFAPRLTVDYSPVPLPGALPLLGAALLAGMGFGRRRDA